MPRAANATDDFAEQPTFAETPAPPPPDLADRLAQARKDLAAMKDVQAEAAQAKPDETIPGGVYIVSGQLVNAWGQPIDGDAS